MVNEDEIARAFDALWSKSSEYNWIYGRLGYQVGGTYVYDVPGQPGELYVNKGLEGQDGVVSAIDRVGAAHTPGNRVKMRREFGHLLIVQAEQLAAGGGGGGGATNLNALTDVTLSGPTDGQTLQYNGTTGQWVNVASPGGGSGGAPVPHKLDPFYGYHSDQLPWASVDTAGSSLDDIDDRQHDRLLGITADQHHDRAHNIITGDSDGQVHTVIGSQYQIIGLTAPNTLGLFNSSSNPGSAAALLRTDAAGSIAIGGTLFVVSPSTHTVKIGTDLFVADANADTIVVGGDTTFNDSVLFNAAATFNNGPLRFNTDPQVAADLNFIVADRSITSSAGIDVTWDLGGDLLLASDKTFRSVDYDDDIPIHGFSLHLNSGNNRQLTVNTIKSDSLHTRLFVADGVRIDLGEERWGKSLGVIHDDFLSPPSSPVNSTVTIYFEDNPAIVGAIFAPGDWILIRYLNQATNFQYGSIWGQVSGYLHRGLDADGRGYQSWTFTFKNGDANILVKKGNVAVDYGVSGQGYIFLSVLQSADGPWLRIGDWSGSDPYTAGNNHIRTQIGLLSGISDTALSPTGYGLYSDNAFLRGMLRTAETIMDDDGLALEYSDVTSVTEIVGSHSLIAWWEDLGARTGEPAAKIAAGKDISDPLNHHDSLWVQSWKAEDSTSAALFLRAVDPDDMHYFGAGIYLLSEGIVQVWAETTSFMGNALPGSDLTYDLGTASMRWRTLYVDTLYVTGGISGETLTGSEWEFVGPSMVIDAHYDGISQVSITNQGTGIANLDVEGSITLGGTIDGVNLSDHVENPNAHHHIAVEGAGIVIGAGQVVSINPLLAGPGLAYAPGVLSLASFAAGTGMAMTTPGKLDVNATIARSNITILPVAGSALAGGGDLTAPRTFSLTLAAAGGLTQAGGQLAVDATKFVATTVQVIAGNGLSGGGALSGPSVTLDVRPGDGIAIVGDLVTVNEAYAFAWTGAQSWSTLAPVTFNGDATFALSGDVTFHNDPQVNANLDFIGAERNITTAGVFNLNLVPGGNLVLNPGGTLYSDVLPGGSGRTDLGAYNRKWGTFYASELYVETLVASSVMATIGGRILVAPTTSLLADTTTTQTTIDVKAKIATDAIAPNTYLYLQAAPGGVPQVEAMRVNATAYANAPYNGAPQVVTGPPAGFRYPVSRGLNSGGTGKIWRVGDAVVSFGKSVGDGYIDESSVSTIKGKIGPTITIYSRNDTNVWDGVVPTVSMGNLNGFAGLGNVAGFAVGNDLTKSPALGLIGLTATTAGVSLYNVDIELYSGTTKTVEIDNVNGITLLAGSGEMNRIAWSDDLSVAFPSYKGWIGYNSAGGYDTLYMESQGASGIGAIRHLATQFAGTSMMSWLDANRFMVALGSIGEPPSSSLLAVLANGNVGIGTSTPSFALHVRNDQNLMTRAAVQNATVGGLAQATFHIAADTAIGQLSATSSSFTPSAGMNANEVSLAAISAHLVIRTQSSRVIRFAPVGVEAGRFDIDGNFLLGGVTVPANNPKLYVFRAFPTTAGGDDAAMVIQANGSGALGVRSQTALYIGSLPGGTGVANITEIGIDLNLRGVGTVRPVALHANVGDLILDAGSVGIGVAVPLAPFHLSQSSVGTGIGTGGLIEQRSTGDARLMLRRPTQDWTIGIDASISDNFGISPGTDAGAATGLTVTTVGRLGINNSSPATWLTIGTGTLAPTAYPGIHVFGGAASGIHSQNDGGGHVAMFAHNNGSNYMGSLSNHPLILRTNNADRITIAASGAVTVTPALSVTGLLTASNALTVASGNLVVTSGNETISAGDLYLTNGGIGLGTTNPGFSILSSAGGVGTALHIKNATTSGGVVIETAAAAQFQFVVTGGPANQRWLTLFMNGDGKSHWWTQNDDGSVKNYLLTFDHSNGFVGINNTVPGAQLDLINNSSSVAAFRMTNTSTSNVFSYVMRRSNGVSGAVTNGQLLGGFSALGYTSGGWATQQSAEIDFYATEDFNGGVGKSGGQIVFWTKANASGAGGTRMTIGPDGAVSINDLATNKITTIPNVAADGSGVLKKTSHVNSSLRYKKDVESLNEGALDGLMQALVPVKYRLRQEVGGDGRLLFGFIAEDVVAAGGKDFVQFDDQGRPDALMYDRLTVPLVLAAQKHERRIAELEARVQELERRLAA